MEACNLQGRAVGQGGVLGGTQAFCSGLETLTHLTL